MKRPQMTADKSATISVLISGNQRIKKALCRLRQKAIFMLQAAGYRLQKACGLRLVA